MRILLALAHRIKHTRRRPRAHLCLRKCPIIIPFQNKFPLLHAWGVAGCTSQRSRRNMLDHMAVAATPLETVEGNPSSIPIHKHSFLTTCIQIHRRPLVPTTHHSITHAISFPRNIACNMPPVELTQNLMPSAHCIHSMLPTSQTIYTTMTAYACLHRPYTRTAGHQAGEDCKHMVALMLSVLIQYLDKFTLPYCTSNRLSWTALNLHRTNSVPPTVLYCYRYRLFIFFWSGGQCSSRLRRCPHTDMRP